MSYIVTKVLFTRTNHCVNHAIMKMNLAPPSSTREMNNRMLSVTRETRLKGISLLADIALILGEDTTKLKVKSTV